MGANTALIEKAYDAFGRGDIGAVIEMLDDDISWSVPATVPHGGQFKGKDGVGSFFQGLGGAWESLGLDVESLSEAGDDLVISVLRASGTRQGGQAAEYGATHVFTVRDGRVVRFREFLDVDAPLA